MNHEDITFPCYKSNTFLSLHLFWDVLHPIPVHPKKGDKTRDGESMSIGDAQPIQIHNKENCGESIPEEFDIVKHHDGLKEMKKTIEDVHDYYLKFETKEEALKHVPDDINDSDWQFLVDYFSSPYFEVH